MCVCILFYFAFFINMFSSNITLLDPKRKKKSSLKSIHYPSTIYVSQCSVLHLKTFFTASYWHFPLNKIIFFEVFIEQNKYHKVFLALNTRRHFAKKYFKKWYT